MCESGLGDFLISDVQPLLLFKQCSMWLHEGLRVPEQPAIVPRTPGSLPTYPPCVGFVLYQLWAVSFFVPQTKMIQISPTTTTLPPENPTRWSSAGPATNDSRTFGTTSRFHHLKPVESMEPNPPKKWMCSWPRWSRTDGWIFDIIW